MPRATPVALPLGPLPPPPGPLNAKHSKRARGAVFNGTHSPVRYSQYSPIRAELDTARVSTARWRPSHRARTSRPVPAAHDKFSAVGAKPRAVPLAKSPRAEWVGSQSSTAGRFYSLGQLPKRADAASCRRNTSSPIATSVHRLHHGRCNTPVSRHSNRNMRSPKATRDAIPDGSGSIRQSAISGRASSSFTSVGGNTSASRTAPPASWAPQRQA